MNCSASKLLRDNSLSQYKIKIIPVTGITLSVTNTLLWTSNSYKRNNHGLLFFLNIVQNYRDMRKILEFLDFLNLPDLLIERFLRQSSGCLPAQDLDPDAQ